MPPIHRGDLVYVAYRPGDQPNSLRAWPDVDPRNLLGAALEGAAMVVLTAATVTVLDKPVCDCHNRLWWRTDHHGYWVCEAEQVWRRLKLNFAPLAV